MNRLEAVGEEGLVANSGQPRAAGSALGSQSPTAWAPICGAPKRGGERLGPRT
jgi:hypothetical protein